MNIEIHRKFFQTAVKIESDFLFDFFIFIQSRYHFVFSEALF